MRPSLPNRLAAVPVVALALATAPAVTADPSHPTVDIQILNVSDWHGQLDPISGVGGAATISSYWRAERAANPNTLTLTAGDAVGATPPVSAFFGDVPTIEAMNLMGFQVDTFGNHNFDHGIAHLQDLIDRASFPYVSANLQNRDANLTGVTDFQIFDVGGVKVGVVGITNPEAPTLLFPGSMGTIVPTDPVQAAIEARGAAKDAGAEVIVVICHLGVTGHDASGAAFGPLIDFAHAVNKDADHKPKIDVIIGDHTDEQFAGMIDGALVYENKSKGVTYARARLTVDAANHKVVDSAVSFVTPLASAVTPDPAVVALINGYRAQLAPILSILVGSASRVIPRADACGNGAGRTCESLIGDVVTDAMRTTYGTDFALTNSGGLRANLTCPAVDAPGDFCPPFVAPPYPISRGQVLGVLPFGNVVVTLTLTGTELKAQLENGVSKMPAVDGRFPQVSGLCVTYDISAPVGSRVTGAVRQAADGSCTGAAVDLSAASSYTLAENDFMVNGGDGYLNLDARAVTRDIMDQTVADALTAQGSVSPVIQGRVHCTTSGATACPIVTP